MTSGGSDVVIIGGGICGIATAYYLARSGVRSTVIERDGLASHASGFAYGGLSGGIPNGPHGNYPVIAEGMRLHRELAVALKDETDVDTQFQDRPALKLALSEADAADVTKHLEWQQAQPGYTVTWLNAVTTGMPPNSSPANTWVCGGIKSAISSAMARKICGSDSNRYLSK